MSERPTAFKPGQSGNPGGRPRKGLALSDVLRTALRAKGEDGQPVRKSVVQTLIKLALMGDLDAIKVIFERVDGKVPDALIHSGGVDIRISELIVELPAEITEEEDASGE